MCKRRGSVLAIDHHVGGAIGEHWELGGSSMQGDGDTVVGEEKVLDPEELSPFP